MIYICLILYMYPSGKTDMIPVEGVFISQRNNINTQRVEWLVNANEFMDRAGIKNNLNPGMVWAEENLCLKADGSK